MWTSAQGTANITEVFLSITACQRISIGAFHFCQGVFAVLEISSERENEN